MASGSTGKALSRDVFVVDSRETGEFEMAFGLMKRERVDAVVAFADPPVIRKRNEIAALALQYRIPTAFPRSENVEAAPLCPVDWPLARALLIGISGKYKQGSDKILSEMVGFDHYLVKPYEASDVLKLLAPLRYPSDAPRR